MKTLAVLTSGGDAPGMNAAIRAVAKVGAARGVRVLGVLNGYDGLIDGAFRELTRPAPHMPSGLAVDAEIDTIASMGGTVLGSARCARFRERDGRARAAKQMGDTHGLIVVGGDGSLTGAKAFTEETGVPVMGIPASIDNDIGCTSTAIGVDTALNTIVDACDRISDTARSHRRAFVIEVMGRRSGYLAIAAGVAAGADAVMFREQERTESQLVDELESTIVRAFRDHDAKRRVLVLKAEGVDIPCTRLVELVQQKLDQTLPGVDVRATVLGHLVRGGRPTYQDRMVASRLGYAALDALLAGESAQMVAWMPTVPGGAGTSDPAVFRFGFDDVLNETKAMLEGTSAITKWRVQMMGALEGVLGL